VQEGGRSLVIELDRATAIRMARAMAGTDGVVVVAGKGHETEQIIAGVSFPWDDRAFVRSLEGGLP
jgi:UDP-N-acetylmuramoyl-L-alanyl-D-glutamate--2,6-diaminopimelate ligase